MKLLSAEPSYVGEALCAVARHLFCDDTDVWPQVHSMYYLGVLPSLAVVCRSHNVGVSVSEKVLIRCHAPNRFGTVNMEDNVYIKRS